MPDIDNASPQKPNSVQLNDFYDRPWSGHVWFPMYVFFMQTMITQYPMKLPDAVSRKRFYYFFMNMAETMPAEGEYRRLYTEALDVYPLAPSLDRREDLYKWLHSVSNHVYKGVGEKERTTTEFIEQYHAHYLPKEVVEERFYKTHRKTIFVIMILLLIFAASLMVAREII